MKSWVSTWLTPSLLLGAIIGGAWYGGQLMTDADTRMFEDAKQKEMRAYLDTSYAFVNAMFKEDRARMIADSLNSVSAISSRANRDSIVKKQAKDIDDVRREQRITSNAVQLILSNQQKILDTIQ